MSMVNFFNDLFFRPKEEKIAFYDTAHLINFR